MKKIILVVIWVSLAVQVFGAPLLPSDAMTSLDSFLGSTYRVDGVDNRQGAHTLFEDQAARFKTAGYNCSGFVVSAVRVMLDGSLAIDDARSDRNGNSGKGAEFGQDWDFGRDLILNIASKYRYRVIMPDGDGDSVDLNAFNSTGFSLHDELQLEKVVQQIVRGNLYLVAFSKKTTAKGYQYLYYHVALMLKDSADAVWIYHSTSGEGVHRIQLNSDAGMAKFQEEFKYNGQSPKRLLVLEVMP